jgi:hypothetical protein
LKCVCEALPIEVESFTVRENGGKEGTGLERRLGGKV